MKGRARIGAAIAFGLLATSCSKPTGLLYAIREDRDIYVEYRLTQGTFTKRQVRLPLADCGFYRVTQSEGSSLAVNREVWRVMSLAPDQTVVQLRYGTIPPYFTQVTPARGTPPPLEPGQRYSIECSGDRMGVTEFEYPADPADAEAESGEKSDAPTPRGEAS